MASERKERGYHHNNHHNNNHRKQQYQQQAQHFMTPSSPPTFATFIDQPPSLYDPNDPSSPPLPATTTFAYVYPISPQFSVQYYTPSSNEQQSNSHQQRYQSYPGSPVLHPALAHQYQLSPTLHPSSPPFSPVNLQFAHPAHHQFNPSTSPPMGAQAFVLQPPHHHNLTPLHISSPILSASAGQHQQIPMMSTATAFDLMKKRQEQLEQEYIHLTSFHPQNIYVRGLPTTETDESFLELCQVYGPISSSKAIIDQKTGECKGYGFAMFEDQEDCQVAINGLNAAGYQASLARFGQESFSSRLRSLQDETSTNIYISNLPLTMDEEGLQELFKPFQTISNRILRDPQSGMSRGVGFARLADRQSASAIIDKYNGHSISGSSAPLQVRFADSPAQKRLKSETSTTTNNSKKQQQPPMPLGASTSTGLRNTRDLLHGFPNRSNMMPITPETMLGIAPSSSVSHGYPTPNVVRPNTENTILVDTSAADAIQVLTAAVEHQLNIKEPLNPTSSGGGLVTAAAASSSTPTTTA